ncbi:MAG: hypothetical protein ACYC9L_11070 [Sulfuricaulis sp.]
MGRSLFHIPSNRMVLTIVSGLCLLTSACATFQQQTCAQFEERRKETDYSTQYRYSDSESETAASNFKRLPHGHSAFVRLYKMQLDPLVIKTCNQLVIHKEIYLQRTADSKLVLEEVREFYAGDGTLIATKTESIGDQLRITGYYTGNTPLPIPENAPAGKYRIVSKLVLKRKNTSHYALLAETSASFQVIARK